MSTNQDKKMADFEKQIDAVLRDELHKMSRIELVEAHIAAVKLIAAIQGGTQAFLEGK